MFCSIQFGYEVNVMAEKIKELRSKTGLTQESFSNLFGIPVSTLRKWEQGESSPPEYVIRLIARALPHEDQVVKKLEGKNKTIYYYNPAKRSVTDHLGNEILIREDLQEINQQNLIIYLEDLFEDFYAIQDRFNRDCYYDKQENIKWSR